MATDTAKKYENELNNKIEVKEKQIKDLEKQKENHLFDIKKLVEEKEDLQKQVKNLNNVITEKVNEAFSKKDGELESLRSNLTALQDKADKELNAANELKLEYQNKIKETQQLKENLDREIKRLETSKKEVSSNKAVLKDAMDLIRRTFDATNG